jgi:hypothetical protein
MVRYRALARDHGVGQPRRQQGDVGAYRTVPVSVRMAWQKGIAMPPIQLGVSRQGYIWIIDGNHSLSEARESGQPAILARFTFGGG